MQLTRPLTAFLGLAMVAFCVSACTLDDRIYRNGPDVPADLIVYFRTETTNEKIQSFWNEVLSHPEPNGRGQFLRPGVGRLSRVESVEGHEGIAIIFFWDAADADRAQLRRDVDSSPIVFTVLENVGPGNVKTLRRN